MRLLLFFFRTRISIAVLVLLLTFALGGLSACLLTMIHFFAIASEMMRRILVNYAESHNAKKRGDGKTLISLDDVNDLAAESEVDLIFLDNALNELAQFDAKQAKIVELKFFGGLTNEEAAEVLGVSDSTIKREWRMARAWLSSKLT